MTYEQIETKDLITEFRLISDEIVRRGLLPTFVLSDELLRITDIIARLAPNE